MRSNLLAVEFDCRDEYNVVELSKSADIRSGEHDGHISYPPHTLQSSGAHPVEFFTRQLVDGGSCHQNWTARTLCIGNECFQDILNRCPWWSPDITRLGSREVLFPLSD